MKEWKNVRVKTERMEGYKKERVEERESGKMKDWKRERNSKRVGVCNGEERE